MKYKADCQRAHAKRRFQERCGIQLTKELRKELLSRIRTGGSEPVESQSLRVKLHRILIGDDYRVVVYDKKRGEIVTVLPNPGEPGYKGDRDAH